MSYTIKLQCNCGVIDSRLHLESTLHLFFDAEGVRIFPCPVCHECPKIVEILQEAREL